MGDVLGCFHTLRHALSAVQFEWDRGRLFSVGKLIDRGPNSLEAQDWIEGHRFEAVVTASPGVSDGLR